MLHRSILKSTKLLVIYLVGSVLWLCRTRTSGVMAAWQRCGPVSGADT